MGGGHQALTSGVRRLLRDFRSERSVRTALCNLRSILDLGTQRSTVTLTGCVHTSAAPGKYRKFRWVAYFYLYRSVIGGRRRPITN